MKTKRAGVESLGDGWYQIRATYVDPKTGAQKEIDRRVQAGSALEADALRERAKAEKIAERSRPALVRQRFADAAERWSAEKGPHLRPSTRRTYGDAMDAWCDALPSYYLDAVAPDDVKSVMRMWSASLAPNTINGRLRVLRTFAKETGVEGMVSRVKTLPLPPNLAAHDDRRGLRLDELRAFLTWGPRSSWWPLLATLAYTGMRFGEVSALRRGDVDLEAGTIRVRRAVHRHHEDTPKTRAGVRLIVVPSELTSVLRKHIAKGRIFGPEALLFAGERGHVSNTGARKAVLAVYKEAGIRLGGRPALHCLRHAWSNALRQVADKTVRLSLVGHAAEESGETYSRAEIREKRAVVGKVMRLVKGGR